MWFWTSRSLNLLADLDWFKAMTRIINGGTNGLADRIQYWSRNRAILGLPPADFEHEEEGVAAFQRSRGLVADGVFGPKTLAALRAQR